MPGSAGQSQEKREINENQITDGNDGSKSRKCSSFSDLELNLSYSQMTSQTTAISNSDSHSQLDGKTKSAEEQQARKKHKRRRKRRKATIIHIPTTKEEVLIFMEDNIPQFGWSYLDAIKSLRFYHIFLIEFFNTLVISFIIR